MLRQIFKGPEISRRDVLAGAGGLSFCIALGGPAKLLVSDARAGAAGRRLSAWVEIAPDESVTILSAGAEMGQGSMTSLPLIIAEEMDADWSRVTVEMAPADAETYGYEGRRGKSMAIVGSRAVRSYFDDLRVAGAQVRKVLLMNAAGKWGVDTASLQTEPGFVVDPASGRRMSYGEIASFGKIPNVLPEIDKSELKDPDAFRLIGKTVPRVDIPAKVNGTAQFAIDVQLPGMTYGTTLHSPVHNGEPESWNDGEIRAMPGVIATVALKKGVAVVAKSVEQSFAAREALNVTWKKGAKAEGFNSEPALSDDYAAVHKDPAAKSETLDSKGDAESAFAGAAKTHLAFYRSDLGYHAQMEPLNAVASFNAAGDRIDVWDGTQAPSWTRERVAKALRMKADRVTLHQCYMGGGFGRRSLGDYTVEAALVAREVGRPVKLIWTREEDIAHGMFRPQSFQCMEAAQDDRGNVVGWRHCVVGDGKRLLTSGIKIPYYGIANQHIERRGVSHGIRLKHWRAVGHVFNVFAIESFVDEIAADTGMDPIDFRFQRMAISPKGRRVFETVARMSDWKAKRPEGRAVGVSLTERSGSLGAGVVEISLDRAEGKIRVHKVWLAVDGGLIVQPDAARANVESGIAYGLSSVLSERVTISDGSVDQSNFHDYHVLRMSDHPQEVHVEFVASGGKPTGIGEVGNPMVAGAVANAFHALTGKRLRHMPFTPERVLEALKA